MTPPPTPANSAEAKLIRAVGTWVLAAGIVNITIGGGIFRLPGGVYETLGQASPVAYIACAIVIGLIVVCFAEAGSRVSQTGGVYAYVETAFGPLIGFVAGVLLWAGMTAALSAVAVFFGDALVALVPALSSLKPVVIAGVLLFFSGLNVLGVAAATRFNLVMTIAKLAPLALLIVVGIGALNADRLSVTMPAGDDLARASVFLMFAFFGIESALVPSGEVKNPSRTIPRAIAIAMIGVVVIYLAIQLVAQSALGARLGESSTPVADAGGALLGSWGRTFILVGSIISMFGYVSGMTLGVSRALFALGRDGFLPSAVATVSDRYRTPHVAILVQVVITMALALSGTFERLAIIANGAILLAHAGCALAVLRLRQKNVRLETEPFVAPFGPLIPVLALLAIVGLLTSLTVGE
jgi:basic amino acid/polyamine antiporter, APA family